MQSQLGSYVAKMITRMVLLVFSALAGVIVAGMVIAMPLVLLYELGIIAYRIEGNDQAWWILSIVGSLWGMSHMLESILKAEKAPGVEQKSREPGRILQMTTYRETYRGYGIFSLNGGEFEVSGPDGRKILSTPSLSLARQSVDEIEAADNPR